MIVSATEIKNNFGKYLALSQKSDISIKKNGKIIAILKSFDNEKFNQLDKLTGIIDLSLLNHEQL
ncbi:type II toxin-antitoxin system Phd/YefM family antitoxin [Lactovum miscens]|uniref:Nitrate reductase NapAB chaperone NapD n=1 Tax=Lactovum miscens TaxID=190387 RepID=A0A841C6I2_9LACT|nr:type II toxin-antitoxin system Phd/YefM family antitoxin [Lactovum miscens]MBB5887877.1 nitrate reductase NapAB chaperone NapD [Lactovum miscens]